MSRDIKERLQLFINYHLGGKGTANFDFQRIALTMEQIEQYNPPPNPAKTTDARFASYMAEYGEESWELDALEPAVIVGLVREAVEGLRDEDQWERDEEREETAKEGLTAAAEKWEEVQKWLAEQ